MNFDHLDYNELITDFFAEYQLEFGRRKFDKIFQKIQTSKKINGLLLEAKQKRAIPSADNYIHSLNEVPYFIFSKADTIAIGALLALERWNNECNSTIVFADETMLKEIACDILKGCTKLKLKL